MSQPKLKNDAHKYDQCRQHLGYTNALSSRFMQTWAYVWSRHRDEWTCTLPRRKQHIFWLTSANVTRCEYLELFRMQPFLARTPPPLLYSLFPILFPVVPPAMHRITTCWVQTGRRRRDATRDGCLWSRNRTHVAYRRRYRDKICKIRTIRAIGTK